MLRQADRRGDDAVFEATHGIEHDQSTPVMLQALFDRLVASNLIRQADLERTYRAARETSQRPDRVVVDLGLIAEAELYRQLGLLTGSALATDDLFPESPVCPELVTKEFAKFSRIIPVRHEGDELVIARVDPFDDEPCRSLEFLTGLPVKALLIDNTSFSRHFTAIYENPESLQGEEDERASVADDGDIERLRGIASEAPIVKLVNEVIGEAINIQASDIHFESSIDGIEVRLRIDGKLELLRTIPSGLRAAVTSRLKIMAKLDIAERRLPQDGRIKVLSRGTSLDLRVSSIPTASGECIVLRILDQSRVELDFSKLGFRSELINELRRLTARPNGILLVTGPTGSGKTTTLYTALSNIDTAIAKVISVEDPVEYQLRGISQIQIHPSIGLSFPQTLRSILRQDPDVIMVGEIRDAETAAIAMQASLTGHLVLSTLHTNSAISSISRLIDMGLERFLIASTLEGVLSQRLVRRLCPDCAALHPDRERLADEFRLRLQDDSPKTPLRICTPVGCASCRNSGYRGRLSIAELFVMSDEHRSLICQGASEKEIQSEARRQGMVDIHQDGLKKIWNGLTSLPEVLAVAAPLP